MTLPQASRPARRLPYAARLGGSLIPMVCASPIIVLAFWMTRQARGGLAAFLGLLVAVVFFAGGLQVMNRVMSANLANQLSVLACALAVYLGQVIIFGLMILVLSGADWLDRTAFGLSVLAVALIWQLSQVTAFLRSRKPVYDQSAEEPTR